ncbi:MAG: winged helix-turn-helix domain-containing protein [Thermomicrobiales bacterium]
MTAADVIIDRREMNASAAADPIACTLDEARMLAVIAQRLDRRPRGKATKERLLETIRHLGCVQLDTISVVARSHETVLWSRVGAYDPADLAALHYPDGALIEYWAHAAALVPIEAYPYFRRNMAYYVGPDSPIAGWEQQNAEVIDHVLTLIRERGPLTSRAFERPDGPRPKAWTWYGGKPARAALDVLWTRGDLMILRRIGFERVYDLTERVLPNGYAGDLPSIEEQRRYFASRSLRAMGVATPRWVADYFRTGGRAHVPLKDARQELRCMADEGVAIPLDVAGFAEPAWLDPALAPVLDDLRAGRGKPTLTTLLSPFDSLVWHRGRAEALFGFEYRIEVYTPEPKRRYGYFSLPILHRGRLVGRLDPVYRRKERVFTVKIAHLEPGVRVTDRLAADVAASLRDYCAFLGGGEVVVLASDPPAFAPALTAALGGLPDPIHPGKASESVA